MARRLFLLFLGVMLLVVPATATHAAGSRTASHSRSVRPGYRFFVRHGYMVGDVAGYRAMKRRQSARAGQAGRSARATGASPTSSASFQGIFDTAGDPPDTTGAIGPNSFVEAVNSKIAVYTKAGVLLGAATFDHVLGPCVSSNPSGLCEYSDPQVLWDPDTRRFYYEDLNADVGGSANTIRWGFSKTASPSGFSSADWCNYDADFGYGANLPDYPKMGQTSSFLMIGANIYAGEAYVGSDIDTITKPATRTAITACPAQASFKLTRQGPIADCNPQGQFASDPNPAVDAGTSSRGFVAAVPDPTNSGFAADWIDLIKVSKNKTTGAPVIGAARCVTVPSYAPPPPAVQPISPPLPAATIDTLDGRLTHAVIAVDPRIPGGHGKIRALWTGHTVSGGAGTEFDWYEVNVRTATAFQTGIVSDPNLYVFNGGISDDRRTTGSGQRGVFGSDMVVGVSTSSSSSNPAIEMASKVGAAAQSAMVMIHQSAGPDASFSCTQNPVVPGKCRWGDYSGAIPDLFAATGGTEGGVWLDNQFVTGDDGTTSGPTWRTWIWRADP